MREIRCPDIRSLHARNAVNTVTAPSKTRIPTQPAILHESLKSMSYHPDNTHINEKGPHIPLDCIAKKLPTKQSYVFESGSLLGNYNTYLRNDYPVWALLVG